MGSFANARKAAEESGALGSGGFYKVAEGANRVRIIAGPLGHPDEFKGQKNFRWLTYVIDRKSGKIRPYMMPNTVLRAIEALQEDPEYAFEDVPMPFDVTINAKGAGTKEVEYTVLPARQSVPLTTAEEADLAAQKSLPELQKALYEKKGGPPVADHHDDAPPSFDPDEVPF